MESIAYNDRYNHLGLKKKNRKTEGIVLENSILHAWKYRFYFYYDIKNRIPNLN